MKKQEELKKTSDFESITILNPLEIISSEEYDLVIKDATGRIHYWLKKGNLYHYDGFSEDTNG